MSLQNNFKGKVVFITGASSGIGRATALAFAKEGASVVIADVLTDEGAQTARKVEELGVRSLLIKCDVSKDSEVKSAIGKTIETFGRIDFAFNNAGTEGQSAYTADTTEENWNRVIDVNLKGVWLCMKYQIPQMIKQGSGSIVNCSSVAGLIGFQGSPAYVASKHGVIGLTKTAALEYAKSKIRVNAVCPGVIQTAMIERVTHGEAQIQKQLSDGEPIGRVGQPEEVAQAVLWLCSDASSFVTGHPLAVDGGWVAQ
ncbi:MAG: SDR family oxidoreductase [Xanthomonadaceae bacterium]|nr:SDR family oxidoreductase [Xanthomonadaceae bacterium]